SPIIAKRQKLIQALQEQMELFKNPEYTRKVSRRTKDEKGQRVVVSKETTPLQWIHENADGSLLLMVRVGRKPINFGKGNAIVTDKQHLESTVKQVISAVEDGELDEHLTPQPRRKRGGRKAA